MSWKDRAKKVLPVPGSDMTDSWRSRATVPTQEPGAQFGQQYKKYPGLKEYDLTLPLKQAWAPNQEQFINSLEQSGFERIGKNYVKAPDGQIYDANASDMESRILRNYPDILIGLASGLTGGLAGGAAAAGRTGLKRWAAGLGAEAATEGLLSAGGEAARQAVGMGIGAGENLDVGNIAEMGTAGAIAPGISTAMSTVGKGLKKGQQFVSGVPQEVSDLVRAKPEIMSQVRPESIELSQVNFNQRLSDDVKGVIGKLAKQKSKSVKESPISYRPEDVRSIFEQFESKVTKPLGSSSPIADIKSDLESRLGRKEQLSLFGPKGEPLFRQIPAQDIDVPTIAATKQKAGDMGFKNILAPSTYKEKIGEKIAGSAKVLEDAALDIENQIARDRLAALNKFQEQNPAMKRMIEGKDETTDKARALFTPSRERSGRRATEELDYLLRDEEVPSFSQEYGDIIDRMNVARENRWRPRGTGADLGAPAVAGILGATGGPLTSFLSAAAATGAQAPATTLTINQLLGYLDRLAAKGGGAVGKGAASAREAALIQLLEDKD